MIGPCCAMLCLIVIGFTVTWLQGWLEALESLESELEVQKDMG